MVAFIIHFLSTQHDLNLYMVGAVRTPRHTSAAALCMSSLFETEWMCARSFRSDANKRCLDELGAFIHNIDNGFTNVGDGMHNVAS